VIVAVLAGREPAARYSLHRGYVDAVWAAGATPVVVVPGPPDDPERGLAALAGAGAVLLSGGGDVHPSCYGAAPDAELMDLDPDRDAFEHAAVHWALGSGRRVLGICRGAQLLNVALGGDLVQDLPSAGLTGHWQLESQDRPVHGVVATPGTAAHDALGGATEVNSIHHQAVRTPGAGLTATAWSPDGVIEAVEGDGVLGVQWHPERLAAEDARHLAPFRWLATSRVSA
jgi:putative glutamine amidotransferase